MDISRINNLSDLQELLELLGRYEISEFEIEAENRKLRVSKQSAAVSPGAVTLVSSAPAESMASAPNAPNAEQSIDLAGGRVIPSPMVGTFYRAPSPEADPFVQVGDRVESDTVLCIIEAMKVMNEITAGAAGVIKEILVKNGESVEYGQPIFHLLSE